MEVKWRGLGPTLQWERMEAAYMATVSSSRASVSLHHVSGS